MLPPYERGRSPAREAALEKSLCGYILHEAEQTTDDAHGEEGQDDDDRADLLLEQLAAQKREQHGGEAGDELVEVLLQRRDLRGVQGGGTDGVVLGQGLLDALGATGKRSWCVLK